MYDAVRKKVIACIPSACLCVSMRACDSCMRLLEGSRRIHTYTERETKKHMCSSTHAHAFFHTHADACAHTRRRIPTHMYDARAQSQEQTDRQTHTHTELGALAVYFAGDFSEFAFQIRSHIVRWREKIPCIWRMYVCACLCMYMHMSVFVCVCVSVFACVVRIDMHV
jgi:hypothetical protein